MQFENGFSMKFCAESSNEAFARMTVSMFLIQYDPLNDIISDIKTAVSEAVTNCIIHGYENKTGEIELSCYVKDSIAYIEITDYGKGIENIDLAMEPLYTSKPDEERSGLGFTVMESFMDSVQVKSKKGYGTKVSMTKSLLG